MEVSVAEAAYLKKYVAISEELLARKCSLFEAKDKIRKLNKKYEGQDFKKFKSPIGASLARENEYSDFPASSYYPKGHEYEGDMREDEDGDIDGWIPSLC